MSPNATLSDKSAFTLIELSIVLVIIGLMVGGVLVGQDLIRAAAIRAEISQIEKYNTAVHTFQIKYGYLPGDIPDPYATQFGFLPRGSGAGQGDGNGMISAINSNNSYSHGWELFGEPLMFWVDLSTANLIDGTFNQVTPTTYPVNISAPNIVPNYLPVSKLGSNLYIYTNTLYNNDPDPGYTGFLNTHYGTANFFSLSSVTGVQAPSGGNADTTGGVSVIAAYNIDKKIDDGLPLSGQVTTFEVWFYSNDNLAHVNAVGYIPSYNPGNTAITPAATTCYDNNGNTSNVVQYSISWNNGSATNCGLSFRFN